MSAPCEITLSLTNVAHMRGEDDAATKAAKKAAKAKKKQATKAASAAAAAADAVDKEHRKY